MAGTREYEDLNKNLEIVDGHAVKAPEDYQDPEELYQALIARVRKYHPSADITMIEKAYQIGKEAHKNQFRKSGEPYIIHPLWVAIILADLEMDKETIVAGMLHDVVEDTTMTLDEISAEFGEEVALLVDGVTKLGQLNYSQDKLEAQAENLRKMFLAMAKDIRVIIVKLADRLHNMRTMEFMTPAKQKEKSRETMDIYAPIAQRLGISKIKTELDDLSLKYYQPEVYNQLVHDLNARKTEREEFVQQIVAEVSKHMKNADIEAKVYGRVKHFFSIYKKMVNQNKTLDQVYDLFAVRIIVDSVKDCYAALGVIHEMYTPIPGRFKDYIAMPKANMYQSLHTTLIGPSGQPFEIQIRTEEMHKTAEYGIAAHWKYKETGGSNTKGLNTQEEKLNWLRQILEWQRDMSDNREFLSLLKGDLDLFQEDVYCFTPNGDVKNLPNGSTPVDFAYAIHSAVGNKMVGARVNGKLVNIDYKIQNGDRIEILTSQNSKGPSRDWLNIVKSTQAKSKINSWFKKEYKEDNIIRGKDLISAYCKSKGINLPDIIKPKYQQIVQKKYGFRDWDAVLAAIGHGGLKEGQVVNRLLEEYEKEHKKEKDFKKAPKKEVREETELAKVEPATIEACEKFVEDVLNAMNMEEVKVTSTVDEEGALSITMEGKNMGILIGKRGQTLDSLQYLTNRVANKMQDGYVRVKLDTEDYRRRRKETLENLAKNIASKVKRTRRTVALEPMNPYERRIIHSALQSDPAVSTHSEGEEPYRKVVVTLARRSGGSHNYEKYDK